MQKFFKKVVILVLIYVQKKLNSDIKYIFLNNATMTS